MLAWSLSKIRASRVLTDEKGDFHVPATFKPELLVPVAAQPHSLDMFGCIEPRLRVTKAGYEPLVFNAYESGFLDPHYYRSRPVPTLQNEAPVFLRPIVLVRAVQ